MDYRIKDGKYIFCKDGVYLSLTVRQVVEMADLLEEIIKKEGANEIKLGAYPDTCVIGDPHCECRKGQRCQRLPA